MRESLNLDFVVLLGLLVGAIGVICDEVSLEIVLHFAVVGSVFDSGREIAIFDGMPLR